LALFGSLGHGPCWHLTILALDRFGPIDQFYHFGP